MDPPPAPTTSETRAAARLAFAREASRDAGANIEVASQDASARSYWRVDAATGSTIVMDAPPGSGDTDAWIDVAARLRAAGLNAPEVLAEDRTHGFLLLSDLGTRSYLDALDGASVERLYADALEALLAMQTRVDASGLPRYGETLLVDELELLPKWFLERHLGASITCDEWDVIEVAFRLLVENARAQPQAFVHRDFHSRNLMVVPGHNPGILDVQDAVLGPLTYDLVSLLRDCYVAWNDTRVRGWAEGYRVGLVAAGVLDDRVTPARWQRWFDLMGLQRHLKVLGIFSRLWYRDGKRRYLADLPRVWGYVRDIGATYPELEDFCALLGQHVDGRDLTQATA